MDFNIVFKYNEVINCKTVNKIKLHNPICRIKLDRIFFKYDDNMESISFNVSKN